MRRDCSFCFVFLEWRCI